MTYGICAEQRSSARNGTDMPSALEQIDRMDIIGVSNTGANNSTHQLSKNVDGNLLPREVAESSERNGDL